VIMFDCDVFKRDYCLGNVGYILQKFVATCLFFCRCCHVLSVLLCGYSMSSNLNLIAYYALLPFEAFVFSRLVFITGYKSLALPLEPKL
jgi:hypothetical protein